MGVNQVEKDDFPIVNLFDLPEENMSEDSVQQVMINNRLIGIVGLDAAIAKAKARCADISDTEISDFLIAAVADHNYIPTPAREAYAKALLRQFKIEQNLPVAPESAVGLRIYVLGLGCARCSKLENDLRDLLSEMQIAADLRHITDIKEIARFGIMGAPALVINDKVVSVGDVPAKNRLHQWIMEAYTNSGD